MSDIRRVGVIGLGRMGLPMATHLLRAGFDVCGYDPDSPREDALARRAAQRYSGCSASAASRHPDPTQSTP